MQSLPDPRDANSPERIAARPGSQPITFLTPLLEGLLSWCPLPPEVPRPMFDRRLAGIRTRVVALAAVVAFACGHPLAAQDADGLLLPPPFDVGMGQPTGAALVGAGSFPAPEWTTYALSEALIWGRDNQAVNRTLVETTAGDPLLTAQDLQFPFGGGVRAFYGRRAPDDAGWEIGYFGLYGQSASRAVAFTPPTFLQMTDPLGGILTQDGEDAFVKYNSLINSAEANLFRTATGWRDWSGGWLTVDWLVGFRYIGVEEQASVKG